MKSVYLLSCQKPKKGGGIYKYSLTEKGLIEDKYYSCDRPMYAVINNEGLYVLLRQPFDSEESGVFSIDLDLDNTSDIISSNGNCACHLCVSENDLYVVNYLSGNLVMLLNKTVTHEGKGINAVRQDSPHTHCVFFSPNKSFVLCCDLGLDTLFCYDRKLNFISKAKSPNGYGIRHALFSNDGNYIYAITEMIPSVCVFSFNGGKLKFVKEYKIQCEKERADGAAIRLSADGKFLYLSLRVENCIVVYKVDNEALTFLQKTDCGGDSPRDFNVIEQSLVVCNQLSDNVAVFSLKNGLVGEKIQDIKIPSPLCAACN